MTLEDVGVVVIGGGSAGLCAAVAAARTGARVVLLEKSSQLGGMGTLAMVHTFCGLYVPGTQRPPEVANPGLPTEIESAMCQRTGQSGPVKMGRVYVLPQVPEVFHSLAMDMVEAESERLTLCLLSECRAVLRQEDGRFLVRWESGGGIHEVMCDSVVDCSADALVSGYLQLPRRREKLHQLQRPAMIFELRDVGVGVDDDGFRMRWALDLVRAVQSGALPAAALGVTMRPSPVNGHVFISMDLDTCRSDWDPSSQEARAELAQIGRDLAGRLRNFLKVNYPSFSKVSEPQWAESIGVRESYRSVGKYTLTEDDLLTGRRFDDVVAFATWPIEMRETTKGARFEYFHTEKPSCIPLSALTSMDVPGLYFAGRCLSATHRALGSVRVMGTCFATGQAAGIAASLHASGVRGVDTQAREIRRTIGFSF